MLQPTADWASGSWRTWRAAPPFAGAITRTVANISCGSVADLIGATGGAIGCGAAVVAPRVASR